MSKSRAKFFSFIIAGAILAISFTFVYAQNPAGAPPGKPGAVKISTSGSAQAKIEGSYKVVLKLPKASPTAILTFCSSGEPFKGAWVEDDGEKFVGEMYNQKINGNEYAFTVKAGPGIWDFVCSSDGKTLKGTVTGDGATSSFEGPLVKLKKEYCTK
jgi:hypothetical protein